MNPITVTQENKDGIVALPAVLIACWDKQVIGFVFDRVPEGAALALMLKADTTSSQVRDLAQLVKICTPTEGLPSEWPVISEATFSLAGVQPGALFDIPLPTLPAMSGDRWAVTLAAAPGQYRANNGRYAPDVVSLRVTLPEPPAFPDSPYAAVLRKIGATEDDVINIVVREPVTSQRRIVLDVAGEAWTAMIVEYGTPTITQSGTL